jgi:phosphomannomutase
MAESPAQEALHSAHRILDAPTMYDDDAIEAAEAVLSLAQQLEQAEQQIKELAEREYRFFNEAANERVRALFAEQRIKELEGALERIANKDHDRHNPWHEALMIARTALSREDSDEG